MDSLTPSFGACFCLGWIAPHLCFSAEAGLNVYGFRRSIIRPTYIWTLFHGVGAALNLPSGTALAIGKRRARRTTSAPSISQSYTCVVLHRTMDGATVGMPHRRLPARGRPTSACPGRVGHDRSGDVPRRLRATEGRASSRNMLHPSTPATLQATWPGNGPPRGLHARPIVTKTTGGPHPNGAVTSSTGLGDLGLARKPGSSTCRLASPETYVIELDWPDRPPKVGDQLD